MEMGSSRGSRNAVFQQQAHPLITRSAMQLLSALITKSAELFLQDAVHRITTLQLAAVYQPGLVDEYHAFAVRR